MQRMAISKTVGNRDLNGPEVKFVKGPNMRLGPSQGSGAWHIQKRMQAVHGTPCLG